jgi:hypothetical protein
VVGGRGLGEPAMRNGLNPTRCAGTGCGTRMMMSGRRAIWWRSDEAKSRNSSFGQLSWCCSRSHQSSVRSPFGLLVAERIARRDQSPLSPDEIIARHALLQAQAQQGGRA